MSQTSLNFYRHSQALACWHRLDRMFFLMEVLFFCKPWLNKFLFPHGGFIFLQAKLILLMGRVT
jgi:hypothetical protein